MLTDLAEKIKTFLKENRRDLFLSVFVFLFGVASFGLGRLSAIWPEKEPIQVVNDETRMTSIEADRQNSSLDIGYSSFAPEGRYVASRNGSSYHLPTCPGAQQIKEENKIWFQTVEEARAAGYKPAGNCPGL